MDSIIELLRKINIPEKLTVTEARTRKPTALVVWTNGVRGCPQRYITL